MTTMPLSPSGPSGGTLTDRILASNWREIECLRETDAPPMIKCRKTFITGSSPSAVRRVARLELLRRSSHDLCSVASSLALSLKLVQFSRYQSPMVKF